MDQYPGSNQGKNVVRSLTHQAMRALSPRGYNESHHLYLGGTEAGDVREAWNGSPHVYSKHLHAAERNYSRYIEAKGKLGDTLSSCIVHGDIVDVSKRLPMLGVVFPDICGTLNQDAVHLVHNLLPRLNDDGVIALTITYSRDGLFNARHDIRPYMSGSYRTSKWWKAAATGRLANQYFMGEVYFSAMIAYSNTGEGKRWGMPMLTLIGRKTNTRKVCDPAYFIRYGENGDQRWVNRSQSTDFTRDALKAHLPSAYKKLFHDPRWM